MKLNAPGATLLAIMLAGCASENSASPTPPSVSATATPVTKSGGFLTAPEGKTTLAQQGRDPAQFPGYVEQLKAQARAQGIDAQTIDSAFANVHFVDRVIKLDRNQPEKKITLDDYLARVMPEKKIALARSRYQQYQRELGAVSQQYGVPPQYVVALWAMESNFGQIQGREDIISALATLAFEGRRESFFTGELMAALKMIQQGHISAAEMKGSWAGAMGQNQFMPSSYLRYGADGDGDGKIDIWRNTDDVFASTANYLAKEGWQASEGWGSEAVLPVDFDVKLAGIKTGQAKSVGDWEKLGVRLSDGAALPDTRQRAWVVLPDDMAGRAYLVYDNFRTIMRWNRSYYFAISIGKMADAVAQ
ncbi:lytic murein transglycosylase [Mixta intestinalis]|jgi:membrane-bound lytic murein transglycosylase B|uniref:Membrane-bound lytic murein transglycosylase B n=1 Tax=Mixta intestinalis TaxID=1615494 RepID=A0A6P1PXD0_9GAMM|nr:lytic murein transglycosylase [Mixta intestinalis]QHM71216.1 Membrane-bound lytic murein transglycosylase B [Mixta intestinalis]